MSRNSFGGDAIALALLAVFAGGPEVGDVREPKVGTFGGGDDRSQSVLTKYRWCIIL